MERGQSTSASRSFAHHEDLRELLRVLAIPREHLLGPSCGAAVAVEFALAYPASVRALVLVSPSLFA